MTYILSILLAAALIGLDQFTKYLTVARIPLHDTVPLWNGVFQLYHVRNEGMSWGLMNGARWLFVVLTAAVLIALVVYFVRLPKTRETRMLRVVLTILFAGAAGNLIDRVLAGYVVDMFHFYWFEFPIFNVADIFVVCSTITLCAMTMFPKVFRTEFMFSTKDNNEKASMEEADANTD